jgi:hypothetical protein
MPDTPTDEQSGKQSGQAGGNDATYQRKSRKRAHVRQVDRHVVPAPHSSTDDRNFETIANTQADGVKQAIPDHEVSKYV